MGGDNAPEEIIKGCLLANRKLKDIDLILVGKKKIINNILQDQQVNNIGIKSATEVIKMDESPVKAVRQKKDSSINIASKLLKKNEVDAFVSAGNTGAVMSASLFNIGRISGIKRPSITTIFPSEKGKTLVLDAGANVDCKAENLLQFALMAKIYCEKIFNINQPQIGLLNIGEEKSKGNKLVTTTYEFLENDKRINFYGNIEGRDILEGVCDVIVCDGFNGNIVLKTTEGVASYIMKSFKNIFSKNILTKIAALLIKPYLKEVKDKLDYRQYGGAPLLGINGVVIISHGSSDATAIFNSIKVAQANYNNQIVNLIEKEINMEGENI